MVEVKDLYHESVDLRIVEAKQQTRKQPWISGSYATIDNFWCGNHIIEMYIQNL